MSGGADIFPFLSFLFTSATAGDEERRERETRRRIGGSGGGGGDTKGLRAAVKDAAV